MERPGLVLYKQRLWSCTTGSRRVEWRSSFQSRALEVINNFIYMKKKKKTRFIHSRKRVMNILLSEGFLYLGIYKDRHNNSVFPRFSFLCVAVVKCFLYFCFGPFFCSCCFFPGSHVRIWLRFNAWSRFTETAVLTRYIDKTSSRIILDEHYICTRSNSSSPYTCLLSPFGQWSLYVRLYISTKNHSDAC